MCVCVRVCVCVCVCVCVLVPVIAAAVVYADQKNESLRFPPPGLLENNGFRSAAAAVSLPDQLISEAESSGTTHVMSSPQQPNIYLMCVCR